MGLPLGLINKINSHKKQEEKYYIYCDDRPGLQPNYTHFPSHLFNDILFKMNSKVSSRRETRLRTTWKYLFACSTLVRII